MANNPDNTYTNPIIDADYSDPDVVRVGDDFYLTASSFNCIPGLPILHWDGKTFHRVGETFVAKQGVWIGAKVGLFSIGGAGYADYDWFRFEPPPQSAQTRARVQ